MHKNIKIWLSKVNQYVPWFIFACTISVNNTAINSNCLPYQSLILLSNILIIVVFLGIFFWFLEYLEQNILFMSAVVDSVDTRICLIVGMRFDLNTVPSVMSVVNSLSVRLSVRSIASKPILPFGGNKIEPIFRYQWSLYLKLALITSYLTFNEPIID